MRVSDTRTSANLAAHTMAKLALISTITSYWFDESPNIIQDALIQDCILA